jgi:hypothetical protein
MAGTLTTLEANEAEKIKKPGNSTKAGLMGKAKKQSPTGRPTKRPSPVEIVPETPRRMASPMSQNLPTPLVKADPPPPAVPITRSQALAELVRRAGEGNETCLAGLRQILDKDPELWRAAGDVSALAERMWIDLVANGNKLAEESIPRNLRELKVQLAGPSPTPLERLLMDYVGVTWLAAQHGEIGAAQVGGSLDQAKLRLRRAESAQKRFTGAVKTFALIRALAPKGMPVVEESGKPG